MNQDNTTYYAPRTPQPSILAIHSSHIIPLVSASPRQPAPHRPPEQLRRSLTIVGLEVKDEYAPLANDDNIKHYSHMWIDERKIPFHLAIKAVKNF